MTDKIEKNELEVGVSGGIEKTDYQKIVKRMKEENLGDLETKEAQKKAAELLKQIEGEEKKTITTTEVAHKIEHTYQRNDGQQRQNENHGEVNANRVSAGQSIIDEINQSQSNVVAKGLQRIIKKIGGF